MHDKIQKAVSTWCFWLLPKYLEIPHFNLSLNPKGFCFTCHSFSWMFCLLSVSLLSVFFCAHSCPCLGQTAVASVCCSLGWAAALFVWLLPLDHLGRSVKEVKSLREATSASSFPHGKRPPVREGGVLAAFPDSFISVILFSVTPQPLPSIRQWMTEDELILANQLFPGSCVLDLLSCWELWSRIYIRCITSQVQRSIPWTPKDIGSIKLYWEHAKGGSDWTIKWL